MEHLGHTLTTMVQALGTLQDTTQDQQELFYTPVIAVMLVVEEIGSMMLQQHPMFLLAM